MKAPSVDLPGPSDRGHTHEQITEIFNENPTDTV